MAGDADNFVTNIHIGRSFNTSGAIPRLGADVPRWLGETVGFWDGDVLDHVDVEHPGLEGARQPRVLEPAANDRDLHAEPRRRRQRDRLQPRRHLLRPRSARGADPHRAQPAAAERPRGRRSVHVHRVLAAVLSRRRARDAGVTGRRRRVQGAGHVRAAVGEDLGGVSRGREWSGPRARTSSASSEREATDDAVRPLLVAPAASPSPAPAAPAPAPRSPSARRSHRAAPRRPA